ncbi:hypothetical protein BH23ACT10_BH23ACT10_20850 [soil metagenome]
MRVIDDVEPTLAALAATLTRTEDALIFGAYAVVALLAGTALLYQRDTGTDDHAATALQGSGAV